MKVFILTTITTVQKIITMKKIKDEVVKGWRVQRKKIKNCKNRAKKKRKREIDRIPGGHADASQSNSSPPLAIKYEL